MVSTDWVEVADGVIERRKPGSTSYLGMRAYRFGDPDTGERIVFYRHPNGQKIKREVRDWDGRSSGPGGRGMSVGPKVNWAIYVGRSCTESFPTLRAAKAWCDDHPREGGKR